MKSKYRDAYIKMFITTLVFILNEDPAFPIKYQLQLGWNGGA